MTSTQPDSQSDMWYDWLLHERHGGEPAELHRLQADIGRYANRVLDGARLSPGMTLADIGTGSGLIAFSAIERIGPSIKVVMTDISAPLLRHSEGIARSRGVVDQCTFLECPADALEPIPDASIDVITTRAVLAYVTDKIAALKEFYRVLKPGGRMSIAEPINRDDALEVSALKTMIDSMPMTAENDFFHLLHRWKAAQYPDTLEQIAANPFTNYTERDLIRFALEAQFTDVHLELHIDVRPSPVIAWDVFVDTAPFPGAPTLGAILADRFTVHERLLLEQVFRPQLESGALRVADRVAYVTATKPDL